ncbi:MAG TPA: prolyl oligopeptidase family serine peptidase, partial [Actinopolymorphaceae bacterium]
WWFDDSDGDELGRWMRQPFDGTDAAQVAVPDLPPGYACGIALGRRIAVIGRSTRDGVQVVVHREGQPAAEVYASRRYARVGDLSFDDDLLALEHSEHGDAFHPAVRVLRLGDAGAEPVGDLSDGPGKGMRVIGFRPCAGNTDLLVGHERAGREELLIWEPRTGETEPLALDLPGDVSASWYPDGEALLVRHHWQARDELYRYDLDSARLTRFDTPPGTIQGAAVRRGNRGEGESAVEFQVSSAARPAETRALGDAPGGDRIVLRPSRPTSPSVPLTDAWVDGPGGRIHALVARADSDRPVPTLFWLHGGPGGEMTDSFYAVRAAFVDVGYNVVHVNYRGSSGYGAGWRDALRPRPGLIELEDVVAVRDWAVQTGVATAEGCVLTGKSWGGYLTLLGIGTQPESWAAAIADVPIGDLVALYEDEMEPVREHDRSLFGGTPEELPEKWARSSPITYAEHVKAPLLVIAGRNDPRCPIRQVENYLARLDELGITYEADFYDAGHMTLVTDEAIRQMRLQLEFLERHVPVDR